VTDKSVGNTGIGLCHVAHSKGYKVYFTMPDKVAPERQRLLGTLADKLEVCPSVSIDEPDNFQNVARRRAKEIGGFFVNQFDNPNNAQAHYNTTGPEIWNQTNGKIDAFVTAAGTAGTFCGVSTYLKEKNPNIKCFIMDTPGTGVKYVVKDGKIEFGTYKPLTW
jgi:cysteine synthase A